MMAASHQSRCSFCDATRYFLTNSPTQGLAGIATPAPIATHFASYPEIFLLNDYGWTLIGQKLICINKHNSHAATMQAHSINHGNLRVRWFLSS